VHVNEALTRGQPESFATDIDDIDGELPAALDGVLFRNGGGTMQVGPDPLAFLDGHSLLGALEVAGGRAFFRAVHPDTHLRREELAAGRMTQRRVFTNLPGWRKNLFNLRLGNGAAHDSYVWGDRVFASELGGHYGLKLPTLEDTGKADWSQVTERGEMIAPMPRDDLARGTLITYSLKRSPGGDSLAFVEIDEEFARVARTPLVPLNGFVHDNAFTDRWYVAFENAARPSPVAALLGRKPLWGSFNWRDEGPTLLLVPRGREGEALRIPLSTSLRTAFHIPNAYDDGDEVVIDLIGYEGVVTFDNVMPSARGRPHRPDPDNRIVRVRANPATKSAVVTPFDGAAGEAPEVAPAVHGKKHGAVFFAALPSIDPQHPTAYTAGNKVGRLDVDTGAVTTWSGGDNHLVSPPAFAPDGSDDPESGWLLAWDLDLSKETTDVVVLDAKDPATGPIARVKLGVYLPAVSHCRFAPGARVRD
jgi:all-trans-8'-apo-beta-carotenal 15,15'-oxygenase